MCSEFDEFVVCVTTRLNDAEQCQTSVDAWIVSNASRSLEAAFDEIRLFIYDCESMYQTDIPCIDLTSPRRSAGLIFRD